MGYTGTERRPGLSPLLLDTHVLLWWVSDSTRISEAAASLIDAADELAVASLTWFELAWMARRQRILVATPVRAWLSALAAQVRTFGTTPEIADTAASLAAPFPNDPADRIIYATAIEHGLQLVTRDQRLLEYPYPRKLAVW